MTPKPFFTIVIPTKNRPQFLRDAIASIVQQDFKDFELIISDNFNDERTKNVINEFLGDSRIQYLRTEKELNIPAHWEFATAKTNGIYTLILTDRSFLKQGALKEIHQVVQETNNPAIVFWKYGYYEETKNILYDEKYEPGIKILDSVSLLEKFSRSMNARHLPRPHLGCYRFDLIQKIRQKAGAVYLPYGPDYTSSLLALALTDQAVFIPRPLLYAQGATVSAGTFAQLHANKYLESLQLSDPYQYIPIKAPFNGSLIFNDLLKVKALVGGNLDKIKIDWVFYFGFCYQELMERKFVFGSKNDIKAELKYWSTALEQFDLDIQKAVKKEIFKRWLNILKSVVRKSALGQFLFNIKRKSLGKTTPAFSSALAAGKFI